MTNSGWKIYKYQEKEYEIHESEIQEWMQGYAISKESAIDIILEQLKEYEESK